MVNIDARRSKAAVGATLSHHCVVNFSPLKPGGVIAIAHLRYVCELGFHSCTMRSSSNPRRRRAARAGGVQGAA